MSESSPPPQHPAGAEAKAKYMGIPGVRFVPSDEELILDYLRAKVDGVEQPTDLVQEADVYEKHPSVVTGSLGGSVEDFWYAFTSRQRKYPKGKRPSRSTGDGRWKPVGLNGPVWGSDEKMIGHKSALSYEEFVPDDGQPQGQGSRRRRRQMVKTEWKMCEFVAKDTDKPISSAPNKMLLNEWVLCRITRKAGADQMLEEVHGGQAALVITEDEQLQNAAPPPPHDPSQQAQVDDGAGRPDGTEVGFPPCDYYDYPQLWNECGEDFDHEQRNDQGNQAGATADPDPMVNQIKATADPDLEEVPTDPLSWDITSLLLDDFVKAMDDAEKGNTATAAPAPPAAAAPAPAPAAASAPAPAPAANKTSAPATPSDQ